MLVVLMNRVHRSLFRAACRMYVSHHLHTPGAQALKLMFALSQTVYSELVRSAGAALSLWASRQQCAPCSPVLHCAEPVSLPRLHLPRNCPSQPSCSSSFQGFWLGLVIGVTLSLVFTCFCSLARRRSTSTTRRQPAPSAPEPDEDLAAAARAQVKQLRQRHGA